MKRLLGRGVEDIDEFLSQCKAIIHVGANEGQERAFYDKHSLSVLWVEALPDSYEALIRNLTAYPKQQAANALLTDKEGEPYKFHISSNSGQSSSIFELDKHKELWPEVTFTKTITLRSTTLDVLLRSRALSPKGFDALILDVQGAELLVLMGGSEVLRSVRYVKAEAADFEAYKGACVLSTLSQMLESNGFVQKQKAKFASKEGTGSCYDVLFIRPDCLSLEDRIERKLAWFTRIVRPGVDALAGLHRK
jgi:FkbM family methyltransferase